MYDDDPGPARSSRYPASPDTALLRKFVADRGKIRARRVNGLTQQQVATAIKNAREMALLPYPGRARD